MKEYLNLFNDWVRLEESEWVPNDKVWQFVYYFLCVQFLGLSPTLLPIWMLVMEYFAEEVNAFLFGSDFAQNWTVCCLGAVTVSLYWINGLSWLAWDFLSPTWCKKKYLVQPKRVITSKVVWKVSKNLIVNQILTVIPLCLFYDVIFMQQNRGLRIEDVAKLPSYFRVVKEVLLITVFEIIIFTLGHLLLHTRMFYRMHKVHHELKQPFALAAAYSHPFENVISNFLPFSAPAMLFRVHPYSQLIMAFVAVMGTQLHHSGWDLPWYKFMEQPDFHDKHHEFFTVNIGVTGLFDWYMGTGVESRNKPMTWRKSIISPLITDNQGMMKMKLK